MKRFFVLSLFLVLQAMPQAHATILLSCEVLRMKGDHSTLEVVNYENSFQTVIVDLEDEMITRVYKVGDDQFKYEYKIMISDNVHLVGVEHFKPEWVSVINLNLEEKSFSSYYSGYGGTANTLSVGQCA